MKNLKRSMSEDSIISYLAMGGRGTVLKFGVFYQSLLCISSLFWFNFPLKEFNFMDVQVREILIKCGNVNLD
jgi:hypothetical protein